MADRDESTSAVASASYVAVQWFQQVWKNRDAEAIEELMAPDAVGHLEGGIEFCGAEGFRQVHRQFLSAFPDISFKFLGVLGNESEACLRWEASGTHSGDGLSIAPTGKFVAFRGMTWFRVRGAKIVEGWDCWNLGQLLADLAE